MSQQWTFLGKVTARVQDEKGSGFRVVANASTG